MMVGIMLFIMFPVDGDSRNEKTFQPEGELPELIIGSDDYEPYNYQDENGKPAGIDVEIAVEACRRMGYAPVFKKIPWEQKNDYLESGKVDCLWGCFTMTGRENDYDWAGPYLHSSQVIVVAKDSDIRTLQDLAGKRISVQATSKPEEVLLYGDDPRIPEVQTVYSMSTMEELYASLRKEYTDAIAGHKSALNTFVQSDPGAYRMLDQSLYISELGVAFQKGTDTRLAEKLTDTLQEMQTDGTMQKILHKYGLESDMIMEDTEP